MGGEGPGRGIHGWSKRRKKVCSDQKTVSARKKLQAHQPLGSGDEKEDFEPQTFGISCLKLKTFTHWLQQQQQALKTH